MPSHVKKVKDYIDPVPLFQRYGAEDQLSAMYQPLVQLKSGGYVVINPTEALVSIDINSGRSTREHNIEQTAFSTNIEAAHEIARQLTCATWPASSSSTSSTSAPAISGRSRRR
jgi:ribonuclease E